MTGVLDLFAGPGGWDLGARALGLDPLGVEIDAATCATREAAGLRTLRADVAALPPGSFGPIDGLIASPPCQAFSVAGRRAGQRDRQRILACVADVRAGRDTRASLRDELAEDAPEDALFGFATQDGRSLLVVEPLRYALALRPRWIALEQVPPVLEVWREVGRVLVDKGWRVWCGLLRADEYGVPQTRERAILIANRDRQPGVPRPTHQRWRRDVEPMRPVDQDGRQPWLTMADALGWPAGVVGFPRRAERAGDGEVYRDRDLFPVGRPAPAMTEKARSWQRWVYRNGNQPRAARRGLAEPAPTVAFGRAAGDVRWTDGAASRRVTLAEAAILQGFPADYPFAGTRSAAFRQVGNAIPPPMARAILVEAMAGDQDTCETGYCLT